MAHLLRLLARHGVDEAVVTVQYLAASIRSYFGKGEDYGVRLSYATESVPLGTAGSVRNARAGLAEDEPFLVVSGDALTDMDLTRPGRAPPAHRGRGHRRPGPQAQRRRVRQRHHRRGRAHRAVHREALVGSGLLRHGQHRRLRGRAVRARPASPPTRSSTGPPTCSRRCWPPGSPCRGSSRTPTGRTSARSTATSAVQRDVLTGRVQARIGGFEIAPSVWLGEDVFVDPSATLVAPCFIGAHSHVGQDATIGPGSVLGGNVVVRRGSRVVGSLLDTGVYVDTGCEVQSALIGRSSEIRARVHVDQGAVIGDQCVLREEAHISPAGPRVSRAHHRGGGGRHRQRGLGGPGPSQPVRPARRQRHGQPRHHPGDGRPAGLGLRLAAAQGLDRDRRA